MEKVFGATQRHDQLIQFGTGRAVLIYGYGEEDGQGYDYRQEFSHTPAKDEVLDAIVTHVDALTDEKILSHFQWTVLHGDDAGKAVNVWLSAESQRNYSEAHRLATLDASKIIPVTFKLGEDGHRNAIFDTFETFEELNLFYLSVFAYIKQMLDDGWAEKKRAVAFVESLNLEEQ